MLPDRTGIPAREHGHAYNHDEATQANRSENEPPDGGLLSSDSASRGRHSYWGLSFRRDRKSVV